MGDCNSRLEEEIMRNFMELYDLNNPVRAPTCYKNLDKPSCIELSLTNKIQGNLYFWGIYTFETGLLDFHKIFVTVIRTYFKKMKPKNIIYRSYKTLKIVHSDQLCEINLYGKTQSRNLKIQSIQISVTLIRDFL